MSFPTSTTDILASAIESRARVVRDNVTKNNAFFAKLAQKGNIKTISGGSSILEEISFAENGNGGAYSGYDLLPTGAQDVISAAQFTFKQYAVPVVISGLEKIQNSGKEAMFDLMEARLAVAEATMMNLLSAGAYSDGTPFGGKALTGLDAALDPTATASQTSTYGGIGRTTWTFWRNYCVTGQDISSAVKCQTVMNAAWANLVRGSDRPDLIIMDAIFWADYLASLQAIQRFTSADTAKLGFPTIKYMDADVVLDGGVPITGAVTGTGGGATTKTAYFLNTKYLKLRPHKDRNMVPLSPDRRYAVNQDAEVQILGWAGNITCSGAQFQGRIVATTT